MLTCVCLKKVAYPNCNLISWWKMMMHHEILGVPSFDTTTYIRILYIYKYTYVYIYTHNTKFLYFHSRNVTSNTSQHIWILPANKCWGQATDNGETTKINAWKVWLFQRVCNFANIVYINIIY